MTESPSMFGPGLDDAAAAAFRNDLESRTPIDELEIRNEISATEFDDRAKIVVRELHKAGRRWRGNADARAVVVGTLWRACRDYHISSQMLEDAGLPRVSQSPEKAS